MMTPQQKSILGSRMITYAYTVGDQLKNGIIEDKCTNVTFSIEILGHQIYFLLKYKNDEEREKRNVLGYQIARRNTNIKSNYINHVYTRIFDRFDQAFETYVIYVFKILDYGEPFVTRDSAEYALCINRLPITCVKKTRITFECDPDDEDND